MVCPQHIYWTELNSSCEHVCSNGSVHSARTDWAPTVLVSLQPIKSWRWRVWPTNLSSNSSKLLQVRSVQFVCTGQAFRIKFAGGVRDTRQAAGVRLFPGQRKRFKGLEKQDSRRCRLWRTWNSNELCSRGKASQAYVCRSPLNLVFVVSPRSVSPRPRRRRIVAANRLYSSFISSHFLLSLFRATD